MPPQDPRLGDLLNTTVKSLHCTMLATAGENDCSICLRQFSDQEEGDDRNACLPLQLKCGHVIGTTCFIEHFVRTGDELCAYCRRNVYEHQYFHNSLWAGLLRKISNSNWFRAHEEHSKIWDVEVSRLKRLILINGGHISIARAFGDWMSQISRHIVYLLFCPSILCVFLVIYHLLGIQWEGKPDNLLQLLQVGFSVSHRAFSALIETAVVVKSISPNQSYWSMIGTELIAIMVSAVAVNLDIKRLSNAGILDSSELRSPHWVGALYWVVVAPAMASAYLYIAVSAVVVYYCRRYPSKTGIPRMHVRLGVSPQKT